jgi:hypothetical protein
MVVISYQMEKTMHHDTVQFILELRTIEQGILPDGVDTDEKVAGEFVPLAIVEGDDVREIVVLEITHVNVQDIIVRAEDDGDVPYPFDLAPRYHPQPAVIQSFTFETEITIFVKI